MIRLGLLSLLLLTLLGLAGQLRGQSRAPETEFVFLYSSETRGEIEECG